MCFLGNASAQHIRKPLVMIGDRLRGCDCPVLSYLAFSLEVTSIVV